MLGFTLFTEFVGNVRRHLKNVSIKGLAATLLTGGYFCDITSVTLGCVTFELALILSFGPDI